MVGVLGCLGWGGDAGKYLVGVLGVAANSRANDSPIAADAVNEPIAGWGAGGCGGEGEGFDSETENVHGFRLCGGWGAGVSPPLGLVGYLTGNVSINSRVSGLRW